MKKALVAVLGLACAGSSFAGIEVTVDPSVVIGPIKPMHAVNNGPTKARKNDQSHGNFQAYRDARFPFARTHDSINQATSGGHTVDIRANSGLWKMPEADGSLVLPMRPNAFAYVEVPAVAEDLVK